MENGEFKKKAFELSIKKANNYAKKINVVNGILTESGYDELSNIAVYANNKIVQLNRQFENKGVRMFPEGGLSEDVYCTDIGVICFCELLDKVDFSEELLDEFSSKILVMLQERKSYLEKVNNGSTISKIIRTIKGDDETLKYPINLNKNNRDIIESYIAVHDMIENSIDSFCLENNLQMAIVKCFIGENRNDASREKSHKFNENNFSKTFKEIFAPQLKELGYEDMIPKTYTVLEYVSEKIKKNDFCINDDESLNAYLTEIKNFFSGDGKKPFGEEIKIQGEQQEGDSLEH